MERSRSEKPQAPKVAKARGTRRYPPRHHNRKGQGRFYAALDLGTNNCRLLIVEHDGNDWFLVRDGFSRVRLGEGLIGPGAYPTVRWSAPLPLAHLRSENPARLCRAHALCRHGSMPRCG